MQPERYHLSPAETRPLDSRDLSPHPAEALLDVFNRLPEGGLHLLDALYTPDVVFIDPAHEVLGLPALKAHMAQLYEDVQECTFVREGGRLGWEESTVLWTMHLRHPRLAGGRRIEVPGATVLRHLERVHYHRDYFDLGAMVYEHVPLLGGIVRALKRRLGGRA